MVRQLLFRKEYLGTKVAKKQVLEAGHYKIGSSFSTVSLNQKQARPDF